MSRTLDKYIFREAFVPFLLSISILTVTALLTRIIKLIELLVTQGAGITFAAWFVLSVIASFFVYILPVSFLIGVLVAFTRLSSDSEITAMKASGLSLYGIARPVLFFAVAAYIINLGFTLYIFPWGNLKTKTLLLDTAKTRLISGIEEKVFYDRFKGAVLYIDHITEDGEMEGMYISQETESKQGRGGPMLFFAQKGEFMPSNDESTLFLKLSNGTIHSRPSGAAPDGEYRIARFSTYVVELKLPGIEPVSRLNKGDKELYINELIDKIKAVGSKGGDTTPLILELHRRFALPASVFVFALLGIPLGIQKVRVQRFTGFNIAIIVVLIYYILTTALETLGKNGLLPLWLSVWGANMIMLLAALYVFYRGASDAPMNPLQGIMARLNHGKRHK
jgi:lipopolysaccharide export system permease protein